MDTKQHQVLVTGYRADAIDRAERSSFYGIFGHCSASVNGFSAAREAVREYMEENGLSFDWYYISTARRTEGTRGGNAFILTITTA